MNLGMILYIIIIGLLFVNVMWVGRRMIHFIRSQVRRKVVIPMCSLQELDPIFYPGEFGLTPATEVHFISKGNMVILGTVKDLEAWVLSVLAKKAKRIFEFGTCTGRTTYLLARNSPADASVTTMTLPPADKDKYAAEQGDDAVAMRHALAESVHTKFFYSGTMVEPKIKQLFMDSKHFDETLYVDSCDLIFVDGSHAYSYVKSDTLKALRMLKPGGVLLWHDYHLAPGVTEGVYRALNELFKQYSLKHVSGTSFVTYRKPA
ncbi:MAG: hypothetical protein A2787_01525 [Omnitrophica WOR_2 bacterium RIFCSPHIGHO2_01_FULL_48_9]|nr:MAG: hypothetical protein A3D10_06090 [Omnitrophica WOR_2 bacterium RIFCSPHIGHO2_02_FULL_48_11]OGX34070.1 MAG: hypothetical protein A2787_01525 [Omnitrophica WOR_2 bacterium RIFCSPHIGHO2_01_FULL_48_9]